MKFRINSEILMIRSEYCCKMGFCVSHERPSATMQIKSAMNELPQSAVITDSNSYAGIQKYYQLGKVIGQGSIGALRTATCLRTLNAGTQVAVRSVPKSAVETDLQVFRQELTLFRLLDHPNILRYYETFEDQRFLHIVTELCTGGNFCERIAVKGLMGEYVTRGVFEKLVRAVLHIHTMGLCHRDLRPENVLYQSPEADADFKIVDFCDMTFIQLASTAATFSHSTSFMAPEVIQGKVGKECDIWSLGAILYYLLSGELPFDDAEESAQYYHIMGADFTFNSPIWSSISSAAKDLIKRMIVVRPMSRIDLQSILQHPWLTSRNEGISTTQALQSLGQQKPTKKLQREMMRTVIKYISPRDIEELTVSCKQQMFRALDLENTGLLSVAKMKAALKERRMESEGLASILDEIAPNADGAVRYTDFLVAAINYQKILSEKTLFLAFKRFDRDDDGFLTIEEMHTAMTNMGSSLSAEELRALLLPFDEDDDQLINFQEFKSIFKDIK